jgi:hypothetical protein
MVGLFLAYSTTTPYKADEMHVWFSVPNLHLFLSDTQFKKKIIARVLPTRAFQLLTPAYHGFSILQ